MISRRVFFSLIFQTTILGQYGHTTLRRNGPFNEIEPLSLLRRVWLVLQSSDYSVQFVVINMQGSRVYIQWYNDRRYKNTKSRIYRVLTNEWHHQAGGDSTCKNKSKKGIIFLKLHFRRNRSRKCANNYQAMLSNHDRKFVD